MRVDHSMHGPRALAAAHAQAEHAKRTQDDEKSGKRVINSGSANAANHVDEATMMLAEDHFFFEPARAPKQIIAAKATTQIAILDRSRNLGARVADSVTPMYDRATKSAARYARMALLAVKNPLWLAAMMNSSSQISESGIATRLATLGRYEERNQKS